MEERNVNTWEEFVAELNHLRKEPDKTARFRDSSLLFRGQENSCWSHRTTLDRKQKRTLFKDYYRIISRIRPHIETLVGSDWIIPSYPEVENSLQDFYAFSSELCSGRCPGYAYMAYLRHHGFPSPLLDWTRSPYIAAFFAFNKATEDSSQRVSIFVFSEIANKVSGNQMRVLHRYGPYVRAHRRHVLQQGEYTLCVTFDTECRFEEYDNIFDRKPRQQGICWKFTLPTTERAKVLRLLDEFNLNAFSLFGSEDSMMESLAFREFDFGK